MRACRRVAEASEHAGRRDASGMVLVGDHQTRAMSKSHPHQAASTAGLTVPPSLAHDGFARLKSTARPYKRERTLLCSGHRIFHKVGDDDYFKPRWRGIKGLDGSTALCKTLSLYIFVGIL